MFHSQEHPHTPGGSGLGSHVVRRTTDFTSSSEAMGSVGPGAAPNLQARWERRRARLRTHIWVRSEPPPLTTPRHRVLRSTYHVQLCRCRLSLACWSSIRAWLRQACGIWCRACTLRRLHGQGSAYVPFTSRGHDCQVLYLPTGCPRHCATLFHWVASVVFVSTDKKTSTSCCRHSGLSSESLSFSLFARFLPVSQIGVSSTPSAFAGESESLQQQAHHQLVRNQGVMSGRSNSS